MPPSVASVTTSISGLARQHPVERPFIGAQPGIEHRLEDAKHDIRLLGRVVRPQHARAQHRRQRQRHEAGHDDRDRYRHREFAEHAADDAAHQQHRNEHRDQRERDRDDGKADLARALQRRLERPHAVLDVADDVFQHDDGVVDHEADRQRQRQQRHVVDGIVERVHHRAGAEQRDRNRQRRNEGRRRRAQEQEDHQDDQRRPRSAASPRRRPPPGGSRPSGPSCTLIVTDGGICARSAGSFASTRIDHRHGVGVRLLLDRRARSPARRSARSRSCRSRRCRRSSRPRRA